MHLPFWFSKHTLEIYPEGIPLTIIKHTCTKLLKYPEKNIYSHKTTQQICASEKEQGRSLRTDY